MEFSNFDYNHYSGPEGTRVKVPPLFFVTQGRKAPESSFDFILVFWISWTLLGYKA